METLILKINSESKKNLIISLAKELKIKYEFKVDNPKSNKLYDPETGKYLNEETMQAIREVENGESYRCKSFDEIIALVQ